MGFSFQIYLTPKIFFKINLYRIKFYTYICYVDGNAAATLKQKSKIMKRHFLIFYSATYVILGMKITTSAVSTFTSLNGCYVNRNAMSKTLKNGIDKDESVDCTISITNIIEVDEKDFDDFIGE